MDTDMPQLKNPDLFKEQSYVDGKWIDAKSGARFDVVGMPQHEH